MLPVKIFHILFPYCYNNFIMYQSEYPASSINILSSETLEPNVVSKSPTMAELIPIYNAFFTASTSVNALRQNEERLWD